MVISVVVILRGATKGDELGVETPVHFGINPSW